MSSPMARGLVLLIALTAIWIGLAILIAGIRAGAEGTPEGISTVLRPLTPLL